MFFYIFLVILCGAPGAIAWGFHVAAKEKDSEYAAAGFGIAFVFGIIGGIPTVATWSSHADDLGTIAAQQEVIVVYERQRDDLNKTMAGFNYPSGALMNADSPVRSIVEQLASVEGLLAEARSDGAKAIKSIEQRRHGPFSGVITIVGDYKAQ
jgi:hypothetical protein